MRGNRSVVSKLGHKSMKMGNFVTCNMLRRALEMYSSAPMNDMGRRGRSPAVY